MRNILLVSLNTLRVTFKARSKMLIYFVMPVLGVLLSLFMNFGATGRPARVGVVDNDGGRFAVDLVKCVNEWGGYAASPVDVKDLDGLVAKGSLDCGLIIPAGFEEGIAAGSVPMIRIVSIKGGEVTGWLSEFVNLYTSSLSAIAIASAGDAGRFESMYAGLQNGATLSVAGLPDVSSGKRITLSSLGFLVYFLLLGASITMQLVLTERRNRTYLRIRTAPVRAAEYISGNGLTGLLIIVAQILVVLLVMKLAFKIDTFVPDLLLFAILLLFGLVAVGFGMAIVAFSRSSLIANVLTNLIITPTSMIAGCFWPAYLMPTFLQRLSLFLPQRWTLDAIHHAQTGGGIGIDLLVIAGFAVAFFLLASYRFARIEDSGQFV